MAMTRQEAAVIARKAKLDKQPSLQDRFWTKVDIKTMADCWNWKAAVRRVDEGYGAFWLDRRHQPSNRVALALTFGEIPDGQQVLHRCDNPKCCNPSHLFLGTNLENNADKVSKKRHAFGGTIGTSKLTDQQVIEIKTLKLASKAPRNSKYADSLAKLYQVSTATIYDVWTRRWNHLEVANG